MKKTPLSVTLLLVITAFVIPHFIPHSVSNLPLAPLATPASASTAAPKAAEAPQTPPILTASISPAPRAISAKATAPVPKVSKPAVSGPLTPVRLSIPSIGFSKTVIKVGINAAGDMDVPKGTTQNVGWYSRGTFPGETGSAVIAAHVFAAFARLNLVKPGNSISVTLSDGSKRNFVVTAVKTHALASMSASELFNQADGKYLRLITCAGKLTPDGSTYDHRLVVYATLAA